MVAAGSLWSYDAESRQVLRIDPRTRHISARLPLPGRLPDAALAAGAGSVWAVPPERRHNATEPARPFPATLARIDPVAGRVVARIVLRGPGSATLRPLEDVAGPDAVWVWGEAGALRIDPATGRIVARVRVPEQRITGFAAGEGSVAVATDFGNVVSFDARSGAEIGVGGFTAPAVGALLVATLDGAVVSGQGGTLALIDPQTGDARWTRHLGSQPRDLVAARGRVWTLVADPVRARSVLLALDPADGRTVERIAIPAEDARALAFDGADPLVTTQGGELLIARP